MKCMMPGQNVKILARALHSLARVGDDLFVDALCDGLILRTVNSSQSAFAEFVFLQSFFSSYTVNAESPELLPKCKISMKSCLSVFKSPHSMDKMVDWCQLRLESEGVKLIFKIKFTGGSTKTYLLPIIESESLQVKYKKSDSIKLVASPKLLSGIIRHFRLNENEITLNVTRQKATFRNHIDLYTEKNKIVRTELGLLAGEFEKYSVNEPVSLTFCLKQLRAVVAFAEPTGLLVNMFFEGPGRPVIFSVNNESAYEGNFVVSTLTTLGESQSQGSHKSDASFCFNAQKGKKKELNPSKSNLVPSESVSGCSNNINNAKKTVCNNVFINSENGISRKRHRDSDELVGDVGLNHKTYNDTKDDNNSGSSVYKSIVSGTSTRDTVLMSNIDMDLDGSVPNSPQNSPTNIVSNVFKRCFNTTFQRSLLPGFNNVIAYDSDGLEDSD